MTKDRERDPNDAGSPSYAAIRERAYELWERNHRPEGMEMEFWLVAERELRAEVKARRSGDVSPGPQPSKPDR